MDTFSTTMVSWYSGPRLALRDADILEAAANS